MRDFNAKCTKQEREGGTRFPIEASATSDPDWINPTVKLFRRASIFPVLKLCHHSSEQFSVFGFSFVKFFVSIAISFAFVSIRKTTNFGFVCRKNVRSPAPIN